jgi:hypothetical protein
MKLKLALLLAATFTLYASYLERPRLSILFFGGLTP